MINTEAGTRRFWASCDECGRPFDAHGLFTPYLTENLEELREKIHVNAWMLVPATQIVLCPTHAWLAPGG